MNARAIVLAAACFAATGCGSSHTKPDASGDGAPIDLGLAAPPLHGCAPDTRCGARDLGMCLEGHTCCEPGASGCVNGPPPPDSGIIPTNTPCSDDGDCVTSEYCQPASQQCCPVGFVCDEQVRGIDAGRDASRDAPRDGAGPRDASADAPRDVASDAPRDGHISCGSGEYCNPSGRCCEMGAVCFDDPSDAGSCLP